MKMRSKLQVIFAHEWKRQLKTPGDLLFFFLFPILCALLSFGIGFFSKGISTAETYNIYVLNQAWEAETLPITSEQRICIVPVPEMSLEALSERISLTPSEAVVEIGESGCTVYYYSVDSVSVTLADYVRQRMESEYHLAYFNGNDSATVYQVDYSNGVFEQNWSRLLFAYLLILLLSGEIISYTARSFIKDFQNGVTNRLVLSGTDYKTIVLGKSLSGTALGILAVLLYLLFSFILANAFMTVDGFQSAFADTDWSAAALPLLLSLLLTAVLLGELGSFLSLISTDYASADSISAFFSPLCSFLTLLTIFVPEKIAVAAYLIPFFGFGKTWQDVLSNSFSYLNVLLCLVGLLFFCILFMIINAKLLKRKAFNS